MRRLEKAVKAGYDLLVAGIVLLMGAFSWFTLGIMNIASLELAAFFILISVLHISVSSFLLKEYFQKRRMN